MHTVRQMQFSWIVVWDGGGGGGASVVLLGKDKSSDLNRWNQEGFKVWKAV